MVILLLRLGRLDWVDKKTVSFKNIELSPVAPFLIVVMEDLSLVKIPDWISFEEASTLPCAGVTV
jgi:hypothetical protein